MATVGNVEFQLLEGRGEKGKKIAVVGGGLAFGLAILAGHPQTILYIFYLTLAYAIFQTICAWQKPVRTGILASSTRRYAIRNI